MHHITISPPLLKQLSATPGTGQTSAFPKDQGEGFGAEVASYGAMIRDEGKWRMAFTLSGGGKNEVKLVYAINIFVEKQLELLRIAGGAAERA